MNNLDLDEKIFFIIKPQYCILVSVQTLIKYYEPIMT